jgi:hypothetical protein
MSQPEINSIQDWESEELSEAELDALAGGRIAKRSAFSTTSTFLDPNIANAILFGDIPVVPPVTAKSDSSYTSYFGATGTSGNEASGLMKYIPFNMSQEFP